MKSQTGCLSHTLPEYRKAQVKEGSVANTYPQLSVKGVGYDHLLGGLEIDIRLRDHLARSFEVRDCECVFFEGRVKVKSSGEIFIGIRP